MADLFPEISIGTIWSSSPKGAKAIFYPGLPHGLTATHADQINADLLKFLKSVQQVRKAAALILTIQRLASCFSESITKHVLERICVDLRFGPDARHGGAEFSGFLPLATDEGESQPVGGPSV
jgi:hypothetical protein